MPKHARLVFSLCAAALLSACGGGGSGAESGPSASPAAPVDNRITLAQYTASRPSAGTPLPATAQQASDYRFATAPLAEAASRGQLNTVLLPALHLNRRALLMAAAQGETLAELQAQSGDPQGLAAGVRQRELSALRGTLLRPGYLQETDRGGAHAQAPASWKINELSDWTGWTASLPADLPPPTLVVEDSLQMRTAWPSAAERFDGLFVADNGARTIKPMLRVRGSTFQLDEASFSAKGLQFADGLQLVSLVPSRSGLGAFVQNELADALLLLNQRLRAGVSRRDGVWVLAESGPSLREIDLMQPLGRSGDRLNAQLLALDGRPHVAVAKSSASGLSWSESGLSLLGSHQLGFHPVATVNSGSLNASFTNTTLGRGGDFILIGELPPCPSEKPDLRPMVLLLLDAQHRLLALASVAEQGGDGRSCQP
jgi:hypothetical protein